MYRVLILDDEYYFRKALIQSTPWKALGIEVCGEAKNGLQALEQVTELEPDIVLADINMPMMDGLEFVSEVKKIRAGIKIIILTGYNEFDYARTALTLGVHHYLLKPINEEELLQALSQVCHLLDKEQKIKKEMADFNKHSHKIKPLLQSRLFNQLLLGNCTLDDEARQRQIRNLNIHFDSELFLVSVLEIDREEQPEWKGEDFQLWLYGLLNVTQELLQPPFAHVCLDSSQRVCVIFSLSKKQTEPLAEVLRSLESLRETVHQLLQFTLSVGVGNIHSGLDDIPLSYEEAQYALDNKLVLGNNQIILHSSVSDHRFSGALVRSEHRIRLLSALRSGSTEQINEIVNDVFGQASEHLISPDMLVMTAMQLLTPCLEYTAEIQKKSQKMIPDRFENIMETIRAQGTMSNVREYIIQIYNYVVTLTQKETGQKTSQIIQKTLDIIHSEFANSELSVGYIAESVHVNYGYLCSLFKKEMGTTMNEYILRHRMHTAVALMDGGENYVSYVAEATGFANVSYFSKCFKKRYSVSPSEYLSGKKR